MRFGKRDNLLHGRGIRGIFEISHVDIPPNGLLPERFQDGIRRVHLAMVRSDQQPDALRDHVQQHGILVGRSLHPRHESIRCKKGFAPETADAADGKHLRLTGKALHAAHAEVQRIQRLLDILQKDVARTGQHHVSPFVGKQFHIQLILTALLALGLVVSASAASEAVYEGIGTTFTFRLNGSGSSFYNTAFAFVQFDADGRIVDSYIDVLEIADPTVSMASCPRYAVVGQTMDWYDLETKEVKQAEVTADMASELVSSWRTKRERGHEYGMGGAGEWFEQMDAYQAFFKGKTVEELKAWGESGQDENGKPVEAISGATMSVNDAHSDILGAVLKACENAK